MLDNAIKHSAANHQVFISAYSQGEQAIIQIQDEGKGIKEGDLPRIFEKFYITDPACKGSGNLLVLAISKRIIEAHQASIIACKTSNQGITSTIYLPIILHV